LPRTVTEDWLEAFASGLARDQSEFGISLLGGDTSAGELSIAITAFGFVPQGKMVKRSGAKIGDAVYVTGTIGDSAGGLAILKGEECALPDYDRDYLTGRYRVPQPPVGFAEKLRAIAHAAVDVSDGLIADLAHVAAASGVGMLVEGECVPLSPSLKALWSENALLRAVTAGDDYQTAFVAPPGLTGAFTRIGQVVPGEGVSLTVNGRVIELPLTGYQHFFGRDP
jgi:thiamine-monophosphate kinase